MLLKNYTDDELIALCKKNNRKAEYTLYKRHSNRLYGVALRYINSKEDANDIFQEGFIKIFNSLDRYVESDKFKAWSSKVMANLAIDFIRKKKINFVSDEILEQFIEDESEEIIISPNIDKIPVNDLIAIVNKLSLTPKTVFNMFVVEGFSHKEISDKLGLPINASKSNLLRARLKLKKLSTEYLIKNNIE